MSASGGELTPLGAIREARGYDSLAAIVRDGIGGWLLSLSLAAIAGLNTAVEFLLLPFEILIDVAVESANNFILEPMGIVPAGAEITAREIEIFDFLALPVSVFLALATLGIVILYLRIQGTSNILPGIFVDNRIIDFLFTSPEEEAQGED